MSQPIVLDGKALAKIMEESIKLRVQSYKNTHEGQAPLLATILVGEDPASATYVKMKGNACARVGMDSRRIHLGDATSTAELLAEIDALNKNPLVHGILLQHPVPRHVDERAAFDAITPAKDVDGVTTHGFGRMAMGEAAFGSATPFGIMKILDHYKIPVEGKRVVVVGRSPILGKPMAMMMLNHHATVTICHSRTRGLADVVREADLVVGAVGKPKFISGDWIKKGAVVIDAGYHPGGVGDVDLEAAREYCFAYTPVPGGVGPMTIASLILQTMDAAENRVSRI